ncbi:hypothetical protein QJQ45_012102 [Haematococcus lacustris]|nr:hypothetical protein QJQ45_012102 [Haematococcus lacustris]
MKKKRLSKAHSAHLNALNNSPSAGYLHCPNNIKAAVCTAQTTNRDLQAEVQRLRDVEQSLMGTVDGLQGDLDDLQAAHQRLQGEHTALQQVACRAAATNHSLRTARHRLQGQVHIYRNKHRPHRSPLTFKQRQQLLVLEQHPVSVEVLRRCAEAGYGRLNSHGRPMGSMAEQLSPAGLAPSPSPTDIFIPTQEGPVGRPAARTAPYNAHHCLSTVRLHLETGVSRRALSKCRQFFVSKKQQLATYLQEHCGAMWTYYQHHVQAQMALPHLFAALGSSDQATRMEVAIDVVYHAELRLPPPEDEQQQQQQRMQQQQQQQQQQEDPYGTWRQYASDIRAMAVNGDPGSPALRLHLEQYYLACPISNAPVESLLQLLKHGGGRYMELPALLQLMSLRTCKEAMKTVDVHDLQQHMGQLRAEVRRKEDATAAAQRSAKAERQITDAAHKVGRVVINVGDHACQQRLAAAHALAFGGHDYGHTTAEEAMKMTGKQLQSYLQFHKQEVHTSWRVPKLQSHVCTHIRGKLAAAAPPQQQLTPAGTTPELAVPAGAPPQQQQQLAAASTSRKRGAPAANKSRAAKQVPRPQAPPWGRWLDRDTNPCLNFQRIGESMQHPLELCSYKGLETLPTIGTEYQQGFKRVNDWLPKFSLNDRFNLDVNISFQSEQAANSQTARLTTDGRIGIQIDIPPPFSMMPKPVLEGAGNTALQSTLGLLLGAVVKSMTSDYPKWAQTASQGQGQHPKQIIMAVHAAQHVQHISQQLVQMKA